MNLGVAGKTPSSRRTPVIGQRTPFGGVDLASLIVVAAFAAGQAWAFVPAVPMNGTDQGTLLLTARALATGSSGIFTFDQPHRFIADQLLSLGDAQYVSKYPVGYPFLCALAFRLGGADAAFLVNPVAGVLALLGVFLLTRLRAGATAAFVATLFLASDPVFGFFAASTMTHTTAAAAGVWAMLCLWRWCEAGRRASLFLCGTLAAMATSFRYAECVLFVPIAVGFVLHAPHRGRASTYAEAGVLAAGAFLVFVPMGLYQWSALGSPLRSGYSLTDESTAFSLVSMWRHAPLLVRQMHESGFLPVAVVGLLGLAAIRGRVGVLLASWIAPILLSSLAYYHRDGSIGDLRLSLTAFAPLAIAAALVITSVRASRVKAILVVGLAACVLPRSLPVTFDMLMASHSHLAASRALTAAVEAAVPRGSAIWVRSRVHYDLEFRGRYRIFDASILEAGMIDATRLMLERPGPSWMQRERLMAILRWSDVEASTASVRAAIADEFAAGKRVFFLDGGSNSPAPAALLATVSSRLVRQWTQPLDFPDGTVGSVTCAIYEIVAPDAAGPQPG